MPSDFQWQTEEDRWDDIPLPEEEKAPPKKRPYTRILIALLIVAGIGLLIFRQVRQQLEAAVQRAEDEVGRTHALVLQAADRSDRDLMNTIISSRDEDWLNETLDVTEAGRLFTPVDFGLTPRADSQPELVYDLNPDLTTAEVTMTRDYTVLGPDGRPHTVALSQTALYRRAEDRWLYSPPQNGLVYWGEYSTWEGEYLTIAYPDRDEDQAVELGQYLENKLDEMCSDLPDFTCIDELRLSLLLENGIDSQIGLTETLSTVDLDKFCPEDDDDCRFSSQDVEIPVSDDVVIVERQPSNAVVRVALPTLSLIGYPADEEAADALYRGYAQYVLQAAMIHSLDYDCCTHALMTRALIDYQLSELGLRPYPLHPGDFEQLFGRFQQLNELETIWRSGDFNPAEEPDSDWAYALIEFLLTTSQANATAGELLQSLPDSSIYTEWMNTYINTTLDHVTVRQAWLNFIYGSSLSGQVAVNKTPPEQKIILRCENIGQPRTVFYSYDWERSDWVVAEEIREQTFFMDPLVDDSAVVVQAATAEGPTGLSLWKDGEVSLLRGGPDVGAAAFYYIGQSSPDGRQLVLSSIDRVEGYLLLNLDDCYDLGCTTDVINGPPTWSPDGSQILVEVSGVVDEILTVNGLQRVNSDGQVIDLSGNGYSPFWFNNEEYGYIELGLDPGLYGANIEDDVPELLVTSKDLVDLIPENLGLDALLIGFAFPNPVDENTIALVAYNVRSGTSNAHFFLWKRQTNEFSYLAGIQFAAFGIPQWLPNGEWLMVPTLQQSPTSSFLSSSWSYHLFNIDPDVQELTVNGHQNRGFNGLDYSVDGQWLTAVNEGFVELVNLGFEVADHQPYRQLLPYSFPNCREAVFIW